MTYLQIVNRVLTLMREPTAASLAQGNDVVVDIVAQMVNDAKRSVEDAHNWNALYREWDVTVPAGANSVTITDSGSLPIFQEIYGENGYKLTPVNTNDMARLKLSLGGEGAPRHYKASGTAANGDVKISVYPAPAADYDLNVIGFRKQDALVAETDVLLVPEMPVIYMALALAARERGEVGGQTAVEVFGMANKYLSDAIAQDASLNYEDLIWYS